MPKHIYLEIGQRFGRLTVLSFSHFKGSHKYYLCVCDCGKTKPIEMHSLRYGQILSCGCLSAQRTGERSFKHGMTHSAEYNTWSNMRGRCTNPNNKEFHNYGGRGIKVCERWDKSFANFFQDMGLRPSPRHSIERKNNNGNYEPGNCVWATALEQSVNKRNSKKLCLNGKIKTVSQWAKDLGVCPYTLYNRINRGWSEEKTLSVPIRRPSVKASISKP